MDVTHFFARLSLSPLLFSSSLASSLPFCRWYRMARVSQPELKRYLDKKVVINIQGGRRVQGTLRGFDVFLNLVVDDTLEFVRSEGSGNAWKEAAACGTVVSCQR